MLGCASDGENSPADLRREECQEAKAVAIDVAQEFTRLKEGSLIWDNGISDNSPGTPEGVQLLRQSFPLFRIFPFMVDTSTGIQESRVAVTTGPLNRREADIALLIESNIMGHLREEAAESCAGIETISPLLGIR